MKSGQLRIITLSNDFHIRALIADRTENPIGIGNTADKRSKANALDDAEDTDPFAPHLIPSRIRQNAENLRIGRGNSAEPGDNTSRRG